MKIKPHINDPANLTYRYIPRHILNNLMNLNNFKGLLGLPGIK